MKYIREYMHPVEITSENSNSLALPSRGLVLIGLRFYPYDGHNGDDERKARCIQKSLYGKKDWFYFNKGFRIIESADSTVKQIDIDECAFDSSFLLYSEIEKVRISINAIVGKNGTGKSTIVDTVIRLLNNLSAAIIGENNVYASAQHLHYVDNVYASLAFYQDSCVKIITCKGRNLSVSQFDADKKELKQQYEKCEGNVIEHYYLNSTSTITILDGKTNSTELLPQRNDLMYILQDWFYTLVSNYSLYAYNYRDYIYELSSEEKLSKLKNYDPIKITDEDRCWLNGVFHKNDGYQTPLVIHPMRENGYINAHKVNEIGKHNLISLCFDKRTILRDDGTTDYNAFPFRTINQTHHIVALVFDDIEREDYKGFAEDWIDKKFEIEDDLRQKIIDLEIPIKSFWSNVIGVDYTKPKASYVRYVWDYLTYKTIKVLGTYSQYSELWKKVEEGSFAKTLNKDLMSLLKDSSHRTLKIRRAICFLLFHNDSDYYLKILKPVKVTDIYDWMQTKEGKQLYPGKEYHKIKVEDLLLPSVFDTVIHLVDNEHLELYKEGKTLERELIIPFEGLSSGERQIAFMVANIIYHLKNIESSKVDVNIDPKHIGALKYNYTNIMLDEVELYFHPDLQRRFIKLLVDAISGLNLPKNYGVSLTIITHSPFVLSDIPDSNVLYLSRDGEKPMPDRTFAANIHDLFNNTFILPYTIGAYAQKEICTILSYYEWMKNFGDDKTRTNLPKWNLVTSDNNQVIKRQYAKMHYVAQIIGDEYLRDQIQDMLDEIDERLVNGNIQNEED